MEVESIFGWEMQEGPPEAGGYRTCMLKGKPVAGIGPQMNPGPSAWMNCINVDSVNAIAAKTTENGGKLLVAPMDVMEVGRLCVIADPSGAVVGAWQAGTLKGAGLVNETGAMCWSELVTTDIKAATDFYTLVFGWQSESAGQDAPHSYTFWKLGSRMVGGMMTKPEGMPANVPSHWMAYFAVDDTDVVASKITELGGKLMVEPRDIGAGRFAVAIDPGGAAFSILKMKAM